MRWIVARGAIPGNPAPEGQAPGTQETPWYGYVNLVERAWYLAALGEHLLEEVRHIGSLDDEDGRVVVREEDRAPGPASLNLDHPGPQRTTTLRPRTPWRGPGSCSRRIPRSRPACTRRSTRSSAAGRPPPRTSRGCCIPSTSSPSRSASSPVLGAGARRRGGRVHRGMGGAGAGCGVREPVGDAAGRPVFP